MSWTPGLNHWGGRAAGVVAESGLVETDPELRAALLALLALVEPGERGDPTSPLRWTTKSTRKLAGELTQQGHRVSADGVADILRGEGFSLQVNAKTLEGGWHPDRDAQFRSLNEQVRAHRDAGQPVIGVDTKKQELLGPFKNAGREWRPAGEPVPVNVYDFAEPATGKVIPYGIDDIAASTGRVNVGTDHDTAAFAVASIRRWWHAQGAPSYPHATPVADHRRCRRRQRLPHPRLEERTARAGRRDRADHHRLPPRNRGVTIPPVFRQRR